jgi:hypothetical protein
MIASRNQWPVALWLVLLSGVLWAAACTPPTATPRGTVAPSGTPVPITDYPPPATPLVPYPPGVTASVSSTAPGVSATATSGAPITPTGGHVIYVPVVISGGTTPSPTPTPSLSPTITLTPTPSLTPTPRWPPALETPGLSKIALHIFNNDDPDIFEYMRVTKPPVVKILNDFGGMAEVKQFSPTTVTIGRIMLAEQPMDGDPVARAQQFVATNLETYQQYPAIDYWEGYNEPATDPASMGWYTRFEVERVRSMAAYGLRAAIGAFSTGTPEFDQMIQFVPAVEAAQQNHGILVLHEYSAPTMDFGMGAPIPGQPPGSDRGPFMLRYRFFYDGIFKPRGLVIPLVVSEAGIDGGINDRPGPEGALGWRDFIGYWSEIGLGGSSSAEYIRQLAWYDQEVRRDDYVIGFTVFTVGARDHPEWGSYDITSILTRLARYVVTQVP